MDFILKGSLTKGQLGALMCERFRITLKPRAEGLRPVNFGNQSAAARKAAGRPEGFWTIEELSSERIAKELIVQNIKGYDIYVTPISDQFHHIVVDDATVESLAQLKADGFRPALVQKSSRDNLQAIVIVPKVARKDEQSLANRVLRVINAQYGDKNITGVTHPFRLAPYWNKKEGKTDQNTTVLSVNPVVCDKAAGMLDAIRNAIPMVSASPGARSAAAGGSLHLPQDNAMAEDFHSIKRADIERFVVGRGWPIDADKIDFQASRQMSAAGFSIEQIAASILTCSPHVVARHKKARKYAIQTATSAIIKGVQ